MLRKVKIFLLKPVIFLLYRLFEPNLILVRIGGHGKKFLKDRESHEAYNYQCSFAFMTVFFQFMGLLIISFFYETFFLKSFKSLAISFC